MSMTPFMELLNQAWQRSCSFVCVGLDPDMQKIPEVCKSEQYPIFSFNKAIIDATSDCVCAYKPQIAYYSALSAENELLMTIEYIKKNYPWVIVILDAKRGDIGATAQMYAQEAYNRYGADAVTVNPYMGGDTLEPFLNRSDKGVIVLCKTSNPGSGDFQDLLIDGEPLFIRVARLAREKWNKNNNVALVVAATFPQQMKQVRTVAATLPFLVPGVGVQGGSVEQVVKHGRTADGLGMIINSSRAIIHASSNNDFAEKAREKTIQLRDEIDEYV